MYIKFNWSGLSTSREKSSPESVFWKFDSLVVAKVIGPKSDSSARWGVWKGVYWYMEGDIFERNSTRMASDVEVIACLVKSTHSVSDLFWGIYRFAAFDSDRGDLYVMGDPCGQSPVYFHLDRGGTWHVCSELEDFVNVGNISLNADYAYLHQCLWNSANDPESTGWLGISCLPAGRLLKVGKNNDGGSVLVWRPRLTPLRKTGGDPIATLQLAVEAFLRQRSKTCLELSGGVESTAIAIALARSGMADRAIAVTYNDSSMAASDEASCSRIVANRLGIRHEVHSLTEVLPFAPFSNPPLVCRPSNLLAQLSQFEHQAQVVGIDANTTVVNGHGGDTLFLAPPPLSAPIDAAVRLRLKRAVTSTLDLAIYYRTSIFSILEYNWRHRRAGGSAYFRGDVENCIFPISPLSMRDAPCDSFIELSPNNQPAKRQQVLQFIRMLDETVVSLFPPGGRSFYPFLSQPMVELALSARPEDLFSGYFDRTFIRDSIFRASGLNTVWKVGKGDTTHNSLCGIARHRDHVRDLCLNGHLVKEGIVNKQVMERQINRSIRGCHGPLRDVASVFSAEIFLQGRRIG
ncbi:asparagine synthase-related protein [Burkholderia lata]|uniref:asparagine synthase (glutamine-hydrolyzing) n=1 Tax=Burkholderia lata (strain ATCC 17760 / DSM 23089 / LMG 22485 / NCIMB 9086 / R18194 / 383) TaxID=482957 RepID=A0A6P2RWQ8_BURL3|nr:asparagine synthase-related protein [Burkholderia lata]VWC37756.1 asparagine synthase [Burkholderia lata]